MSFLFSLEESSWFRSSLWIKAVSRNPQQLHRTTALTKIGTVQQCSSRRKLDHHRSKRDPGQGGRVGGGRRAWCLCNHPFLARWLQRANARWTQVSLTLFRNSIKLQTFGMEVISVQNEGRSFEVRDGWYLLYWWEKNREALAWLVEGTTSWVVE